MFYTKLWNKIFNHYTKNNIQENYLLKPQAWLRQINFIKHLTLSNNILTVIYGDERGGKTSFIKLLQQELIPHFTLYKINALTDSKHSPSFLLTDESLTNLISTVNQRKFHCLLLIDNAHNLSDEKIQSLLKRLQTQTQDEKSYFHLCLLSNPTLNQRLHKLSLKGFKDCIHSMHLGCLNLQETESYLAEHQLFFNKKIELNAVQMHRLTQGKLALINQQLPRLNKIKYSITIAPVSFRKAGLAAMLAVVAMVGTFINIKHNLYPINVQQVAYSKKVSQTQALTKDICLNPITNNSFMRAKTLMSTVSSMPLLINRHANINNAPGKYTIQIAASKSLADMHQLVKKIGFGTIKQQISSTNQTTWYVLTTGQFQQLHQAQLASEQLSKRLLNKAPWVRNTQDLQDIG